MAQTNDEIIYDPEIATIRKYCTVKASEILLSVIPDGKEHTKEDWINWRIALIVDIVNKEKQKARLAALDDCKTSLEEVLSRTKQHEDEWDRRTFTFHATKGRILGLKQALAELEALRKKVRWGK